MSMEKSERFFSLGFEDDSNICHCTSLNKSWTTKLDKLCKQFPKEFKMVNEIIFDGVVEGKEYEFPKNLITIRTPKKREVSEEQKQAARERMKKMKAEEKIKKGKVKKEV